MSSAVISLCCQIGESVYLTYFECGDAQTIILSRFNCVKGLHDLIQCLVHNNQHVKIATLLLKKLLTSKLMLAPLAVFNY